VIELGAFFLSGGLWITPRIWNNSLEKLSKCMMLFDTGATMTTIDISIANRAGISIKGSEPITVHGADNRISGHLVIVKELWLGNLNLGAVAVHVIQFNPESEVQAVLGMNIIKEFKVTIDLLMKTADYDGTVFMSPTYDTTEISTLDTFDLKTSRFGR